MTSVISESKKGIKCNQCIKCIDNKRSSKANTGPMLVKDCNLINRDEEKPEAFNTFFASVFNNMGRPWAMYIFLYDLMTIFVKVRRGIRVGLVLRDIYL